MFVTPDWRNRLRGQLAFSRVEIGAVLTQLGRNNKSILIVFYTNNFPWTEKYFYATSGKLLGWIYNSFKVLIFLKDHKFEVTTDSKISKYLMIKSLVSRKIEIYF